MLLALTAALSLGVLALLVWRASKGPARRLEELSIPIRGLLRQGYDGGFLLIHRYREIPFLQLRKYIRRAGEYGIELAFPLAQWASAYERAVRGLCADYDLVCEVEDGNGEMTFLYVDFGKDVALAHRFVVAILTHVFGWKRDSRCFTVLENADSEDVIVGE